MSGERGRLRLVDALRGVAASYVMLYHFYGEVSQYGKVPRVPAPLHHVLEHGMLGVNIFFVLSGFVIALSVYPYVITPGFVGRFALRRSLRLDPLYWLMILVMYVVLRLSTHALIGAKVGVSEGTVILANMAYLDNLLRLPPIVAVGWTLCLELQFYLVFVISLGLGQQLGKVTSTLWGKLVVFLPFFVWSVAIVVGLTALPLPGLFLQAWCMFLLGAAALWVAKGESKLWLGTFVVAGVALVIGFDWGLCVALATAILLVAAGDRGRERWLGWGWLQFLGKISYSLYLVHPLVGHRITRLGKRMWGDPPPGAKAVLLYVAALVASILAAWLCYLLIERPTLKLAKRIKLVPSS